MLLLCNYSPIFKNMKRILLLCLASLMLAGCSTTKVLKPSIVQGFVDYSMFTENGIYASPSYNIQHDYVSIGEISVEGLYGYVDKDAYRKQTGDNDAFVMAINGQYKESPSPWEYQLVNPSIDGVMNHLVKVIKEKGGNGIIGLDCTYKKEYLYVKGDKYDTGLQTINLSGLIIKTEKPLVQASQTVREAKPRSEVIIDGIKCFIIKSFPQSVAIMTEQRLTQQQVAGAIGEFNIQNKDIQFFLPDTTQPYFGYTADTGYLIDYKTNSFIKYNP